MMRQSKTSATTRQKMLAALMGTVAAASALHAQTFSWTNVSSTWSSPGNWSGNAAPTGIGFGDTLIFGGASSYTAIDDVHFNELTRTYVKQIAFQNTVDGVAVSVPNTNFQTGGNVLSFSGAGASITKSGAGSAGLMSAMYIAKGTTLSVTSDAGAGTLLLGLGGTPNDFHGGGNLLITNN